MVPPLRIGRLGCIAVTALLFAFVVANGQEKKRVYVKAEGKVVAVLPGTITASADGKVYQLTIKSDQNAVAVTGTLPAEKLQKGMIVRCEGTLKGSSLEGELSELKVYSPADGYQPGVLQDSPDQPATITGTLQSVKKNVVTIMVGRKRVTANLADDAKINVESKDYSLARPGDAISFKGYLTGGGTTINTPREVVITLGGKSEAKADADKKPVKSGKT